ncbi:MAG TPA: carbonic anhydrase [Candidatus Binatia bacterium]|nr:carbonic anhydrase [Candidatus Binatia bacterium]
MKSQEALAKILSGLRKFQTNVYPAQRGHFQELSHGQHPIAMLFTCADSRIVPAMLLQSGPGEVFIERTPGNIVPRYSDPIVGTTASVEYALLALRVPLIIVCGHTDCGVIKALLEPEHASGLPALQAWMRHALPARERLLRDDAGVSREQKLLRLTGYNVLTQMDNLKTLPAVEAGLAGGSLELHGWIYDIGEGAILSADPATGAFEPLSLR